MSLNSIGKYEITIGIECHVQLATKTKLFSRADNDARDKSPNSVVSLVDYAIPGTLPVLNHEAVNLAIKAAKALNAEVAKVSRFDRKHYFYPDLPKGYQTTQMFEPIILGGYVDAPLDGGKNVRVRVEHAHLEEDAGKLTHYGNYSLVDLNRAGTPLIEIVSMPDIHSPAEAKAYAQELYYLMTYAGVTLGDLYQGNMRFDVNISVAAKESKELGARTEIKNLNSFRSIERAAEYEANRQIGLLEKGEVVKRETLGWDEAKQKTVSQRSKEEAKDYRYMPDPDIPPIVLTKEYIEPIQEDVGVLPPEYREKWQAMSLDGSVVDALLAEQTFAKIVTGVLERYGEKKAKRVANWFASDYPGGDNRPSADVINTEPALYTELARMVEDSEVSSTAAKEIFSEMLTSNLLPAKIAENKNLLQVSDESEIEGLVDQVINDPANSKAVNDIKDGNDKVVGFLVGQVMKISKGKANPPKVKEIIVRKVK